MKSLLINIFKRIFSGDSESVFAGMLTLLAGASLARAVGLLSIPVLARIYSPEDFGTLALYISFVAILTPVMTLRYVQAIPLPKTDLMAFNLFCLCLKLVGFFTVVIALVLAVWGGTVLRWFDMEALLPWRWLIVLGTAGTALYELFSFWATRKKEYKAIAKTQLSQSLIGNIVKVGLGVLSFRPEGLIVGQFLSQSAGVISFFKSAKKDFRRYLPRVSKTKGKIVAAYYQDFVWFRLPSQLLMVLSMQAPVMMVAALYNKEVTGQLSLAMVALSLPVGLIGNAMSKAYYAEIAAIGKRNIEKIINITLSVQKKLFLVGLPISVLIYYLAESLFRVIFGEEWAMAGFFASVLAPFVLFQFTSSPLMEVINILGVQLVYLILQGLRLLGLMILFMIAFCFQMEVDYFIIALSVYFSVFYLLVSGMVVYLLFRRRGRGEKCIS